MKTLYLVRHAKSSWEYTGLSDRERPLNNRGYRDVPKMVAFISNLIETPQLFVSSPAKRTLETAKCFLNSFEINETQMIQHDELYHADSTNFINVISQLENKYDSVMIFSHNPGITTFVNSLSGARIMNIPTCGVAAIDIDVDEWGEIREKKGELVFYHYPKGI